MEWGPLLTVSDRNKLQKFLKSKDGKRLKEKDEGDYAQLRYKLHVYDINNNQLYRLQQYSIVDKEANIVPLRFNNGQLKVWSAIAKQMLAGVPVRIIILKARQWGGSTMTGALLYDNVTRIKNVFCYILSYEWISADILFQKHEVFYDNHPKELFLPEKSKSAARNWRMKELGSQLKVGTANKKEVMRGGTVQHLHVSEVAMFDKAESVMLGLVNTVPKNLANTSIILESTARGTGTYFHKMWKAASNSKIRSRFEAVFVAWHEIEEYSLKFVDITQKCDFEHDMSEEEVVLQEVYNLTNEQLNWRRLAIQDECGGSIDKFHQEYPSNPEEAFLTSGQRRFNVYIIDKWQKVKEEEYRVSEPAKYTITPEGEIVKDRFGNLTIYEEPERAKPGVPPREYLMSGDVAEGKEITEDGKERDDSVLHIYKRGNMACDEVNTYKSLTQVASWSGKIEPYDLAGIAYHLGMYYNRALAAIEANQSGGTVNRVLSKELNYPFVYCNEIWYRTNDVSTKRLGFYTSSTTRPLIIDTLAKVIEGQEVEFNCLETIAQFNTFVFGKNRKLEAQSGCKDDHVLTAAIAVQVNMRYREFKAPKDSIKEEDAVNLQLREIRIDIGMKKKRNDSWSKKKKPRIPRSDYDLIGKL